MPAQQWEYVGVDEIPDHIVEEMNDMGREGWEAFAVVGVGFGRASRDLLVLMKRPVT